MENPNPIIIPPHLNAEVYRTNTTGNRSVSYLDYIKIHSDGAVLIGSSELTGRYWDGGASIFKDITDSKAIKSLDNRSISLPCGTADGCFIDSSEKVLLCCDSGAVSIYSYSSDQAWQLWTEEKTLAEHEDAVLGVDCLKPGTEYVTVGADGNAKVWDINLMICTRTYEAHSMPTYGVAVRPNSNNTFATSSHDEYVYMWDENTARPAVEFEKNDCGVHCLQWLDENNLIVGDDAGALKLLDVRNTEQSVNLTEFPTAIHRIVLNSKRDKIAVCCDNTIVSVCDIPDNKSACDVVYHDRHMHSYFVRGLAWDSTSPTTLHTVGWNCDIHTHTIL